MPFTFTRRQFPIRPAFVNKAQGQTFQKVVPSPVFSHGQRYIAESRVNDPSGVRIMVAHPAPAGAPQDYTTNVVYTEGPP